MTSASNNANQTRRGRPFEPGNRAGRGRKAGSRNRASIALDKMAEGEAKEIALKLIEKAKDGDIRAAELVLVATICGGGVVIQGWDEPPGSDADRADGAGAVCP